MIEAVACIQRGDLAGADSALKRHLAAHPADVEALRLAARLALHRGEAAKALEHFQSAAKLAANAPDLNFELGVAWLTLDRAADAADAFQAELRANPDHPGALYNAAWIAARAGQTARAVDLLQRLTALQPGHGQAWFNLGNALSAAGSPEQALQSFDQALKAGWPPGQVHVNMGAALAGLGRLDQAETSFRLAAAAPESRFDALMNLGNLLSRQGRFDEAFAAYDDAAALRPRDSDLLLNQALALHHAKRRDAAEAAARKALAVAPGDAAALNCLAVVLIGRNKLTEAEQLLRAACAAAPDWPEPHGNMGVVLGDLGRQTEALDYFRRAHDLDPENAAAHSNMLFLMRHMPQQSAQAVAEAHFQFGAIQEKAAGPEPDHPMPEAGAKIRIGYVSPDFRRHAVALLFEPVLASHDRTRFEIFCYRVNASVDDVTEKLQSCGDVWRSIAGLPPDQAARIIRNDRIDILVDLAGHSADNALPVFARKPAPVQITWLGYPGTSGLSRMDYRITDAASDPPGRNEAHHSETLIRITSLTGFRPPPNTQEPPPPPCLQTGRICFGSFNKPAKINDDVVACWARLLEELPEADLLMMGPGADEAEVAEKIMARFARHGIRASRIKTLGQRPLDEFLDIVAQVDVALDPWPYSGGTTTAFTLWMGVPTVAMAGDDSASSVSRSYLSSLGRSDWIAADTAEYTAIARKLAGDTAQLGRLRSVLRRGMESLAQAGMGGTAAELEAVYQDIHIRRIQGLGKYRPPGPTARLSDPAPLLGRRKVVAAIVQDGVSRLVECSDFGVSRLFPQETRDCVTPRYSPDGKRLAFARRDDKGFQIVVHDFAAQHSVQITDSAWNNVMPAWNRDGTELTWHAAPILDISHGNQAEIYIWSARHGVRRLTDNTRMDVYPEFNPRTGDVVFESGDAAGGGFGIYSISENGVETRLVHDPQNAAIGIPDIAPDGMIVVEAALGDFSRYGLALLHENGEMRDAAAWKLCGNPTPRLSPDGAWIAACGPGITRNGLSIRLIRRDDPTSEIVLGGDSDFFHTPRWSADGEIVAAADAAGGLILADRAGRIADLPLPGRSRGQRFMEIWNFDIR